MVHPKTLDEAVMYLLQLVHRNDKHEQILEPFKDDERGFLAQLHHFVGRNLRNEWFLWWFEDHNYDTWPKEKPAIVQHFNDMEIVHADDMSGIILTSLYRKYFNKERDLEGQIKKYHDHWLRTVGSKIPPR
jgi:hypothetical protein